MPVIATFDHLACPRPDVLLQEMGSPSHALPKEPAGDRFHQTNRVL